MNSEHALRKLVLQLCIADSLGSLAHLPQQLCQPTDATNYTPFIGGKGKRGYTVACQNSIKLSYLPLCPSFCISVKTVLPVESKLSCDSHVTCSLSHVILT